MSLFGNLSTLWLATVTSCLLCLLLWAALSLALEAIFIIKEGIVVMGKSIEVRKKGDVKREATRKDQEIWKIQGLWNCWTNSDVYLIVFALSLDQNMRQEHTGSIFSESYLLLGTQCLLCEGLQVDNRALAWGWAIWTATSVWAEHAKLLGTTNNRAST